MNPFTLEKKVILVTGASSGIGRATCVGIAQAGGTVIATGRSEPRLAETMGLLQGQNHQSFAADLTQAEERAALIKTLPPVSGVFHSAGVMKLVPYPFVTEKHLREIHQSNYEAPVLLTQGLFKQKRILDGASIVFVASTSGMFGARALAAYAGSKGALIASSRVLALEMAPRNIRSNCIAPALVETPMAAYASDSVSSETFEEGRKLYPLGLGTPEDVANAAVFLLADASRWITGTTMILDGGYTCQ